MKSKHDKLLVSSISYPQKISSLVCRAIEKIRLPVLEKIDAELKKTLIFKEMPFLWLGIIESYGDYDNKEIIIKNIDKKYGDLSVTISIPIKEVALLSTEQLALYYENMLQDVIKTVINEFMSILSFDSLPVYLKGNKEKMETALAPARKQLLEEVKKELVDLQLFQACPFEKIKILEYYGDYQELDAEIQKVDSVLKRVIVEIAIPFKECDNAIENPKDFFNNLFSLSLGLLAKKYKININKALNETR